MGAQVRRGIPRFLASVPVLGCLQCLSEPRQGPRPNGARERLLPPPPQTRRDVEVVRLRPELEWEGRSTGLAEAGGENAHTLA